MMKITKKAHVDEKDIPDPKSLAAYVKILKLYLKENELAPNIKRLIKGLPSPRVIKTSLSWEECKIIFETINYLWKEILGKDILKEQCIEEAGQEYLGNYWIFKNGVILNGENHFTAIKRDSSLITTILGLNGISLQYYLSTNPDKLIRYILKNGGVRMFVNKDNKGFFTIFLLFLFLKTLLSPFLRKIIE